MFVDVNGKKINYETSGEGRPVVYVHGNFGSHRWYDDVMKVEGFKTYALDLPNFGDSDRIDEISVQAYSDYLWGFVEALKMERPLLVGHSLGGAVALRCALDHSEGFSGLLLVDPSPARGLKTPEENYPVLDSFRRRADLLEMSLMGVVPTKKEAAKKLTKEALKMKPEAFTQNARALENYDYSNELSNLKIPVRLIFGTLDPIVPKGDLEKMEKQIPDSRLDVIEKIGHSLMIEDPDRFKKIVTEF